MDVLTLIECFDTFSPQNIASCLYLRPEKLIFLGDQAQIEPYLPHYRMLLTQRNISTRISCCHVPVDQMETMVQKLQNLLQQDEAYAIDISGGDERILLAVGAALASMEEQKQKKITVQCFDPVSGMAQPLGGTAALVGQPVRLCVRELVQLQGGVLHPDTPEPQAYHTSADLDKIWALACQNPGEWNRNISILREFESRADSEHQVFLPLREIRNGIANFESKLDQVRSLLAVLHACGVIRNQSSGDYLEYAYTSPLMRRCTKGAGNLLEIKVLLEARAVQDRGENYFHDCQLGVHIDWDGVVYDQRQRIPNTKNEVDLILMRGMMPLFVSCKNGDVKEEELYKLNTVATRFGGPCAPKMLIATDLSNQKPGSCDSLVQRGLDMGIFLVPDAATLTKQGWTEIFLKAMQDSCTADKSNKKKSG